MLVYWLILIWELFLWAIYGVMKKRTRPLGQGIDDAEQPVPLWIVVLACFPIIFFIGLRTSGADTEAYINGFKNLTTDIGYIIKNMEKNTFFYVIEAICKRIVDNYSVFFIIVATFTMLCLCKTLRKYSHSFFMSMFLFVVSADISYMFNGMKQYMAIVGIFAAFNLLVQKKYLRYIIVVVLFAQIHNSAYIALGGLFCVMFKPWSKKYYVFMFLLFVLALFSKQILTELNIFENTIFEREEEKLLESEGVNIIRGIIMFIPLFLLFIYNKNDFTRENRAAQIVTNMVTINVIMWFAATLYGGNLLGRLAQYFTSYNMLAYPIIFSKCMSAKERKSISIFFIMFYIVYFWYQMDVNWGIQYISSILGIGG